MGDPNSAGLCPDRFDVAGRPIARAGLDGVVGSLQSWLNTTRWADLALVLAAGTRRIHGRSSAGAPGLDSCRRIFGSSLSVRLRALNVIVVVAALAIGSLLVGHILFESVMQVGA